MMTFFLTLVFMPDSPGRKFSSQPDSSDFDNEPHKRRNQVLSVFVALGAMLSYALLTGILSIQHVRPQGALDTSGRHGVGAHEEEEED